MSYMTNALNFPQILETGDIMETYIILVNVSGAPMADFDPEHSLATLENTKKALEEVGGKMLHIWMILGRFDHCLVVEVPNSKAITAFVSMLPGHFNTETLTAFSMEAEDPEIAENAKKIRAIIGK